MAVIIEQKFSELPLLPLITVEAEAANIYVPTILDTGSGYVNYNVKLSDLQTVISSAISSVAITVTTLTNTVVSSTLENKSILFLSVGYTQTGDYSFTSATGTLDFTSIGGVQDTTIFVIYKL